MLIKCPECELQVSDKAISCPHCGYPIDKTVYKNRKNTPKKRMRLPNGFGQISEIKGRNLRKPFRAMVTVGKNENGRPICKPLKPEAYFETYNDAYAALVEYNKNPYDLSPSMTMKELYDKWTDEYFKTCSPGRAKGVKSAWTHCSSLYDMRVVEVRVRHIKGCFEESSAGAATKLVMKSMLNSMFDYAVEYEMTDKNYARLFSIPGSVMSDLEESYKEHIAFTEDEMNTLWKYSSEQYVRMILIQCYSGWRPQELLNLRIENIKEDRMTGGMKTEAGKNRTVPIHSKIKPLIDIELARAKEYNSRDLFNNYNKGLATPICYSRFKREFNSIMKQLDLNPRHRPHDGRKQFVSMAKKYHVDEYALKRMVGHAISDLTEKVYTDRDFEWFVEEIEKIK